MSLMLALPECPVDCTFPVVETKSCQPDINQGGSR
jgi:hypothetical protein